MKKVMCIISYDGACFNGFQIQPGGQRTIQGEIESVLYKMHKGIQIRVDASGRTDAGVHAKEQTIQFVSPLNMPEINWKKALNTMLPDDIHVRQVHYVAKDFHVRYDAVGKEYRYFFHLGQEHDVFKRHYVYQYPYTLDISAIHDACRHFQGTHDFTTFSSAKATTRGSKVRTLHDVHCEQAGSDMMITFYGDGFLYKMVRIITGALLDVGTGKMAAGDIPILLEKKDRRLVGVTAPPQGLYLWRVLYE